MRKAAQIVTVFLIASLPTLFVYSKLQIANEDLARQKITYSKLESDMTSLRKQLDNYKNFSKSDMYEICIERAKDTYSEYIRRNSVSFKEGNITTLYPKSPETTKVALQNQQLAETECGNKFGR